MRQRGRKSAASLSVPRGNVVEMVPRPPPPSDLTDEQAEEWKAIVGRLPAEWFPRETWPVLVQFCRHTVPADLPDRAQDAPTGQQSAMRSCPRCGGSFIKQAPAQKYCGEDCQVEARNARALAYKRRRQAAAERVQTAAIVEQNQREGYGNLSWGNGHAST
jgi:hypothetical protein